MENVSGRERLEKMNETCLRKTGRLVPDGGGEFGVDPNRNWGVDWGVLERDYNPEEEYGGAEAFSEPESRIIKKLVEDLQIHAWVNVHSGMAAMFLPIDYKAQVPEDEGMLHNARIIGSLKKKYCTSCEIGSGGATVGYRAHGTIVDYLWEEVKVPLPMTWEVMGDTEAPYYDCVRMFNPLTQTEYNDVVHRWSAATLEMVRLLPVNPKIPKYDSFVAPSMAELPVPDMKGFTGWHKENIDKLGTHSTLAPQPARSGEVGGGDAERRGPEGEVHEEYEHEEEELEGQDMHMGEENEVQEHEGEEHVEEESKVLTEIEAGDLEDRRERGKERGGQQGSRKDSHVGQGISPSSRPQERGTTYNNRPTHQGLRYNDGKVSSNPLHFQYLLLGCILGLLFFGFQVRKRYRAKARSRRIIRSFSGRHIGLPM